MRIRKGDQVSIRIGNDRGKQGKVLTVHPSTRTLIVEGINMRKKHVRARKSGQKGEVVRTPLPIPASRVMLVCSKCGKPTRVSFRLVEHQKSRICKKCGAEM